MSALPPRAEPAPSAVRGLVLLDVAAFALPAASFLGITIIGRLIVTEILLLALLPWLWRARDRPPLPRWFVLLWAGWLLSQIVTDVVVGSAFRDFARGWAGIIVTLTNFAAILVLAGTPKRARLFAVGLAVGGVLGFLFTPHQYAALDPWKWGLALPAGFLVASALSGRLGDRSRWLPVVGFGAFGVLNLLLGYRSLGGISIVTGGYLCFSALIGPRVEARSHSSRRAALGVVFLAVASLAVLGLYGAAASRGLLGSEAQVRYLDQGGGVFGALLGGRPEALVSSQAILDSPVLGHGSWAKDPVYAELLAERQASLGYEVTQEYIGTDLIPAHSYLMGAWVWAGFLGALFWFAAAATAVRLVVSLYTVRVKMAPLLVFGAMVLLWDIAFSPYGLNARITAPYGLALCLLGLHLVREMREAAHPPGQASQSSGPLGSLSPAAAGNRADGASRRLDLRRIAAST